MSLPFTPAEMVASAIGTINACRTVAELESATALMLDGSADWSGAMVAAVTDAYEAKKAHLSVEAPQAPDMHPHRETTINRAIAGNVYITDPMVDGSATLREVAINFVQTYTGHNTFVQNLAVALVDFGRLSVPQMRGALNVMVREAKIERSRPAPDAFNINFAEVRQPSVHGESPAQRVAAETAIAKLAAEEAKPVVPNGTYTVPINDHGEYRVIRLTDCPESFNKPAGTQIAAYQSGSDNESDFTGFAFVMGADHRTWQKFRNARDLSFALVKLLTTGRHGEFGKLWAMESKRCFICNRKLTVPISKLAGIGPRCAENTGIDINALAALNSADVSRKERAETTPAPKTEKPKKNCGTCAGDGEIPDDDLAASLGLGGLYVPCPDCRPNTYTNLVAPLHKQAAQRKAQADIDELFPDR